MRSSSTVTECCVALVPAHVTMVVGPREKPCQYGVQVRGLRMPLLVSGDSEAKHFAARLFDATVEPAGAARTDPTVPPEPLADSSPSQASSVA